MIESLTSVAMDLINYLGYFGIYVGILLTGLMIPLPSEITLGFAGYMVFKGEFNMFIASFIGALGHVSGASIMFWIGRYKNERFLGIYRKFIPYNPKNVSRAERFLKKYGEPGIFYVQMVPVLGSIISIPVGASKVKYLKFLTYAYAGNFFWCLGIIFIAKTLAENWKDITKYLGPASNVVMAILVLIAIYLIYMRFKKS